MGVDAGNLPADYTPYRELEFCSNHFVNTPLAIEVEGQAPVLVGAGAGPRVWLSAPTGQDKRRWTLVVADNTPRVTGVDVRKTSPGHIEVLAADTKVLEVREVSSDTAAVTWLDLRPLGLDIHGDNSVLWIGTNQFSANRIENCNAAIGIGP
jgi:hypothetical protein